MPCSSGGVNNGDPTSQCKGAALIAHLERIAVDEHRGAVLADERIAVIHVADHMTGRMNLREGARHVGGRAHDETKVRIGKSAPAALRAVQPMRVLARR